MQLSGLIEVVHIPIEELPQRTDELPRDRLIGVICSAMTRSAMAYLFLRSIGYEGVRIVEGGYAGLISEIQPARLMHHLARQSSQ